MEIKKHCPNCGFQLEEGTEFCSECGYDLKNRIARNDTFEYKSFFENLTDKTSFPLIVFSFVIFGVFLFIGSIIWSSFMANGSIDLITYLILTIVFAVFFGGIFVGYAGCRDNTYIIPNFTVYLASVYAVVLCGIGLIFTFLMGILASISSAFSSLSSSLLYGNSYQPSFTPSLDVSGVFKIILFILLIPVASYIGVYLGYILKQKL